MTFNLPNGERIGFIESENSLKDSLECSIDDSYQ